MKLLSQKTISFYLTCLGIMFMSSCAQTPSYEEGIKIIVTPHKLSVCSGSEDKIFVKLLDKQGGPLFGVKINATSTSSTVATVMPEALTDAAGKAMFTVKGISPGTTGIVFSVAGQSEEEYAFSDVVSKLEQEMEFAARNLQFEKAAFIRDKIKEIKNSVKI